MAVFILLLGLSSADARNPKLETQTEKAPVTGLTADIPVVRDAAHSQGKMQLIIRNNGTFGSGWDAPEDPITGERIRACIYPKGSDFIYLYMTGLWVGAVVGRDTLVSCGAEDMYCTYEFWPEVEPFGQMEYQSIDVTSPFYNEDAYSEQDIICIYTDTITDPGLTRDGGCVDLSPHRPLNIKATQRSMAWSYDYADDFILFDYLIENIGHETLKDTYMGFWLDGCVFHRVHDRNEEFWTDDIVGFYRTHPSPAGCGFLDTINIAYHSDNDGDPEEGQWDFQSPRSAVGVLVVRTPSDSLKYNYNWWIMNYGDPSGDFGPRQLGTEEDPFRDFGARLGTPVGDANKYYMLRHDEFDYDLLTVAVDHSDSGRGWLPPPEHAEDYANGYDVRYLLSFGPFDINPGEKLPISFAWVGGENFHVNPSDFSTFNPYRPSTFYDKLDFSELAANSRWASWIYDNPGVDTDGDGDSGQYRICCLDTLYTDTGVVYGSCDTTWYKGDGIPDFRGASPPPAPIIRVEPRIGALRIRFNGLLSETTADRFSGFPDFEGYRVYVSRDDRISSFTMLASYDIEDYNKYVVDSAADAYLLLDPPFTLEELRELYGTPFGIDDFQPLMYTANDPYTHPYFPDSQFYFVAQDFNQSIPGVDTPIRKIYPDQPYPTTLVPEEAQPDELTEDGYLKYFEYEMVIEGLQSTIPYYVNVTAFDFGSPEIGLASLETSILNGICVAYPMTSVDEVEEQNLEVFVYPNPYRADARYDLDGYENRDGTESADRMRRIHFANLPRECTIYIYSIDGDLIREIEHSFPQGGPEAMHDTWDLVTRNTQAVVSGLYYYVVESDTGTQMGKFVIIR